MIKWPLAALLFFLLSFQAFSARISGTAKGFEGDFVRLYRVMDFISFREEKVDVWKVGSDGKFTLNTHFTDHELIRIRIRDVSQTLIIPPGSDLDLVLTYDSDLNRNRIFDKEFTISIKNKSDQGINQLIWDFQRSFAAFVEGNQQRFVTKQARPAVQQFKDSIKSAYSTDIPVYFSNFLEYSLAALEDAVMAGEVMLFEKYFKGRPIEYNNLAYMSFFMQFYQERFIQLSQGKEGFQVLSAVNGSRDRSKLMNLAEAHKLLEGKELTELFLINGLREVYGDETFKKDKVLTMLQDISSNGEVPANRSIARNVAEELTFLNKGKEAPSFNLSDADGNIHHLSDQKGRPVLLFFWSANSMAAVRQLSVLSDLQANYGNRMVLISICMDDDRKKAVSILSEMQVDWISLYKDAQYDVSDKYRVLSLPSYTLIGAGQQVFKHPAGMPETTLEAEIQQLLLEN